MACVKAGGDRQELHEAIRTHSMLAAQRIKEEAADNDLMQRIAADPLFAPVHDRLGSLVTPADFVGRAPAQVEEFIADFVDPELAMLPDIDAGSEDVNL